VKHLRGTVDGVRANGKDIGLAILHGLEHAAHIMAEALCHGGRIFPREQRSEIRRLRRVTPEQLDRVLPLEHARHLVTRQEDRDLAGSRGEPFHQLPLGVRIGAIHFIQD
jgi:hypothetical protein